MAARTAGSTLLGPGPASRRCGGSRRGRSLAGVIAGTLVENYERNHGIRGTTTGSLYVLSEPAVPDRFPGKGLCMRIPTGVLPALPGQTPGLSKECSMTHTPRLHRSELAVPGSNVRMLEK